MRFRVYKPIDFCRCDVKYEQNGTPSPALSETMLETVNKLQTAQLTRNYKKTCVFYSIQSSSPIKTYPLKSQPHQYYTLVSISIMSFKYLLHALAVGHVTAQGLFSMCTENQCNDCPVGVSSAGTGYPACVVYDSDAVFTSDFGGIEGG